MRWRILQRLPAIGWEEAVHLLWRPYVLGLLRNTLLLMLGVTIASALIGLSLAWLLERSNLPGRRLWGVILCLPFAVPAFVSSFTWVSLSASFEGLGGAILVMTLSKYPLIFLPVAATLRNLDPSLEESARTLGLVAPYAPPLQSLFGSANSLAAYSRCRLIHSLALERMPSCCISNRCTSSCATTDMGE